MSKKVDVHSGDAHRLKLPERHSRLRLVRRAEAPTGAKPRKSASDHQREKIKKGLDELRAIKTKEAYLQAVAQGISFDNGGFRARVGVGTNTLHYKHSDLFKQLQAILDYIYPTFKGVPRNKKGRSPSPKSLRKATDKDNRIAELEALLELRETQFLDLLNELKSHR